MSITAEFKIYLTIKVPVEDDEEFTEVIDDIVESICTVVEDDFCGEITDLELK